MVKSGSRASGAVLGAVLAGGAAAFAWGSLVERNRFTIRREVVPILEPGSRPVTALHFSDLHMAPWQRAKQEWVRSLIGLEPDFVVNTGDNMGHADALEGLAYAFEPFVGTPGVFVHGSNDYFGPSVKNPLAYFGGPSAHRVDTEHLDTPGLEKLFGEHLGWSSLNNAARALSIGGSNFEFFGTNDAHRNWDKLDALPGLVDTMREEESWFESSSSAISIGVTHAPYQRVLNAFVTNGAELIFAGHTHGGQVRIPGLPALVTNCDIPRRQAEGLSIWEHANRGSFLNVSAGIGTSIYAPVRFACPPEAVLVTLTDADISYS
jgi:predicted MPP superfamily phosphohydrolase